MVTKATVLRGNGKGAGGWRRTIIIGQAGRQKIIAGDGDKPGELVDDTGSSKFRREIELKRDLG
jgi:hypothetical protein